MNDVSIRIEGCAGRITLNRPQALNALTHQMCLDIEAALDDWQGAVDVVVIDAAGDKAFCAGGDITQMYEAGRAADFGFGPRFWRDEYRLNLKIAEYPQPVVSLMQGFTMGGGVGIGCHASHRVVCEGSRIAMPECGIGLVPDVGGSWLLSRAPGRTGLYLGLTGARMHEQDAIYAGFADYYVPCSGWHDLTARLVAGDVDVARFASEMPAGTLARTRPQIDALFGASTLGGIADAVRHAGDPFAVAAADGLQRGAPLSLAVFAEMMRRLGQDATLPQALRQEFRVTSRAARYGDFLEGIRAQVIDKDRKPVWKHTHIEDVTEGEVAFMLAPLMEELSL